MLKPFQWSKDIGENKKTAKNISYFLESGLSTNFSWLPEGGN
jgi:hypothetical protein